MLDRPDKKPTDIKIDKSVELPKIQIGIIDLPKPPEIKTRSQLKQEAEQQAIKDLIPFSLKDEYDLSTYEGRFR